MSPRRRPAARSAPSRSDITTAESSPMRAGSAPAGPATRQGRCATRSRRSIRRGRNSPRRLRAASFKGLREDKAAEEIELETPARLATSRKGQDMPDAHLTHPERILWEEPGITKQGLAEFYAEIAEWILPHI